MRQVRLLLALGFICVAGCNDKGPGATPSAPANSHFAELSSNDGTFLINESNGQVWRFDSKNDAFLKVPLISELSTYNQKTRTIEKNPDPATIPSAYFNAFSSSEGTFVLERTTGRAWRYNEKSQAFQEVAVTNKVIQMRRNSKGELEEVTPDQTQIGK